MRSSCAKTLTMRLSACRLHRPWRTIRDSGRPDQPNDALDPKPGPRRLLLFSALFAAVSVEDVGKAWQGQAGVHGSRRDTAGPGRGERRRRAPGTQDRLMALGSALLRLLRKKVEMAVISLRVAGKADLAKINEV